MLVKLLVSSVALGGNGRLIAAPVHHPMTVFPSVPGLCCLNFMENKVYVEIKVQTAADSTLSFKCLNRLLTCLDIASVGSVIKGPGRELCQVMGSIFQIL